MSVVAGPDRPEDTSSAACAAQLPCIFESCELQGVLFNLQQQVGVSHKLGAKYGVGRNSFSRLELFIRVFLSAQCRRRLPLVDV